MDMDMDLEGLTGDLGLALPTSRRPPRGAPLAIGEVRELTGEDIVRLQQVEGAHAASPSVRSLRERHHQLAVLLSQGIPEAQCTLMTGYSGSRISILKADPAFKNLLAYYSEQQAALNVEVQERMKQINMEALGEIQHRLDEQPDSFTNLELMRAVEILSDRTGNGKTSTVAVKFGLDDSEVERLKRQHNEQRRGSIRNLADDPPKTQGSVVIDGEAYRAASQGQTPAGAGSVEARGGEAEEDRGSDRGVVLDFPAAEPAVD